jgi:hypothetical protein
MGLNESVELGHAMAELSANKAGDEWREEAYAAFCQYAKAHPYFTNEEVRAANPDLVAPFDERAWGAIALRAKRQDIVVSHSWVRARSQTVHGSIITQWESKIYGRENDQD